MLMCAFVRDVCTCVYMHACRVHACAMPYFDLAVHMFIDLVVSLNHWTIKFVLVG